MCECGDMVEGSRKLKKWGKCPFVIAEMNEKYE
ncbi:hypothetical protein KS4_31490 [Poriferisphaera corsica]|uniref:Uncharacterized protein n=1 Tax=Poriferisphaera corsica TaxID=2528020 RepID=A0A517YXX8_9BACT|nr:hypothetical protein KS4_31490 [Poriferisphaera corsica]